MDYIKLDSTAYRLIKMLDKHAKRDSVYIGRGASASYLSKQDVLEAVRNLLKEEC